MPIPRPLALACLLALPFIPRPALAQAAGAEREIQALLSNPGVRRALDHVEETDAQTMEDLLALTQIPAPPFMEQERGRVFRSMLEDLGVDTSWVDPEGNVVGVRRGSGSGKTIVFSGHLDTVFPEGTDVTVQIRGDTLAAPGIADDTRGLATVLAVLRAMNAAGLRTDADIWFVGTVGEEGLGDLRGVKHLFREGIPHPDIFISIDGTGAEGITHEGLGSHRYRITFKGPGGHSWGAFGLANPAHALGRAIRYFQDGADPYTRSAPRRTSYNVGVLGGGTSVNSVPFEAWMEVDMRSEGQETLAHVDSILQAGVQRALVEENELRRRGEPLTVDVQLVGDRPSGSVPAETPFLQRAIAATKALGLEPRLGMSSTDSNVPISLGIPSITIGGGGVGVNAHSLNEFFINENGALGIQRALVILVAEAGLANVS
ncbi:MAG: M20/M25/M40 family metallo-hydrolase [Gemmatimonadota bacterium]